MLVMFGKTVFLCLNPPPPLHSTVHYARTVQKRKLTVSVNSLIAAAGPLNVIDLKKMYAECLLIIFRYTFELSEILM